MLLNTTVNNLLQDKGIKLILTSPQQALNQLAIKLEKWSLQGSGL